jgi:hypothetical protein
VGCRRRGVSGVGGEGAPESGAAVLWLEAEAREVAMAQRQSGEGKSPHSGEKLGRRRWGSLFKGAAGGEAAEGGRVSRVTHGGGARESEGGGAAGVARERLGSRQQPPADGSGRRCCRATVEGGGVGATQLTGGPG